MRGVSQSFYLVQFEHPPKVIKSKTESIMFCFQNRTLTVDALHKIPDQLSTFKLCTLDFDPSKGEKAVILKINILYTHNEFESAFFWNVSFQNKKPKEEMIRNDNHPDETGKICIVVPGSTFKGLIPSDQRLVYEPRLVHLDIPILPFIGIENHILKARSTCITSQGIDQEYQAFNQTDPLLVFLLQHKNHFDEVNAQDIKKAGPSIYLVKRHLTKRIQNFFKNSVCSLIKYVEKPTVEFAWEYNAEECMQGFVSAIIQVDYVVLSPEVIRYKTTETKLDI